MRSPTCQVATVSTTNPSMRDEIWGWSFEDSSLFVRKALPSRPNQVFIGYTGAPTNIPSYGTVLEMLADGWRLLGPPQKETIEATVRPGSTGFALTTVTMGPFDQWVWWLTREVHPE